MKQVESNTNRLYEGDQLVLGGISVLEMLDVYAAVALMDMGGEGFELIEHVSGGIIRQMVSLNDYDENFVNFLRVVDENMDVNFDDSRNAKLRNEKVLSFTAANQCYVVSYMLAKLWGEQKEISFLEIETENQPPVGLKVLNKRRLKHLGVLVNQNGQEMWCDLSYRQIDIEENYCVSKVEDLGKKYKVYGMKKIDKNEFEKIMNWYLDLGNNIGPSRKQVELMLETMSRSRTLGIEELLETQAYFDWEIPKQTMRDKIMTWMQEVLSVRDS